MKFKAEYIADPYTSKEMKKYMRETQRARIIDEAAKKIATDQIYLIQIREKAQPENWGRTKHTLECLLTNRSILPY